MNTITNNIQPTDDSTESSRQETIKRLNQIDIVCSDDKTRPNTEIRAFGFIIRYSHESATQEGYTELKSVLNDGRFSKESKSCQIPQNVFHCYSTANIFFSLEAYSIFHYFR